MTEKTFALTFEIYVDAKNIIEAVDKGNEHARKSKHVCDLVGVRELIYDDCC